MIFAIGAAMLSGRRIAGRSERSGPAMAQSVPMATRRAPAPGTQEVSNQPPPLADYNAFEADRALREAVRREGADWAGELSRTLGALAGSAKAQESGRRPTTIRRLRTHDRYGNRIDEVEFHPAWHELMRPGGRARAARARPGATRGPAPTSPAAPPSCAWPRPRRATAARSR